MHTFSLTNPKDRPEYKDQHDDSNNRTRVNFVRGIRNGCRLAIGAGNAFGILTQAGQIDRASSHHDGCGCRRRCRHHGTRCWCWRYGNGLCIATLWLGLRNDDLRFHRGLGLTTAGDVNVGFFFCEWNKTVSAHRTREPDWLVRLSRMILAKREASKN